MSVLMLTIHRGEPLVVGDGEIVITVLRTDKYRAHVQIVADKNVQIDRGSVFFKRKIESRYENILADELDRSDAVLAETIDSAYANKHLQHVNFEELTEKSKRLFILMTPRIFLQMLERVFPKFLVANNLRTSQKAVEQFVQELIA